MRVITIAFLIMWAGASAAQADGDCSAPLAEWQPREALVAQLKTQGWRDIAIRIDEGCYLVRAVNGDGERLHGKFDPATLAAVKAGGHGHGGEEEHGRDRSDD
jgi:hypothetical protein